MRYLVALNFKTGFRTSPPSESDMTEDTISSDTFYGAIVYWAFKIFPEKATGIANNLKISSMFFKSSKEYFVPKPLIIDTLDTNEPKKVKKASYVSLNQLKKLVGKNEIIIDDSAKNLFLRKSDILEKQLITRNALDRITNASMLYAIEIVRVKPDYKPVFLFDISEEYENEIKAIIKILGDSGLGADSTYGFGIFNPEFLEVPDVFKKDDGDWYITLGYYLPSQEEYEKLNDGYYRFKKKSGVKKDKMERKFEINFIEEGSTFPFKPMGRGIIKGKDFFVQTSPVYLAI